MKMTDETQLKTAIEELRGSQPDRDQITSAGKRVAERLGLTMEEELLHNPAMGQISNCEDVQHSLAAYRSGSLTEERSLVIEAHLHDCGACLRHARSGSQAGAINWSRLQPDLADRSGGSARPSLFASLKGWAGSWALAPALALVAGSFFLYRTYWQVPPGVRAEVQSIDGAAYRNVDGNDRQVEAGDTLREGDRLRIMGGGHAVLKLADGSTVEVNERSVLGVGARGRNMTLALDDGAVIVQAAKRDSGHLYVKTPDCRVAVTGTVFSVNSGIKGSRVAVLEGSVHMLHAGLDTVVKAGNEATTSDNLNGSAAREQVTEEIAWSHDRDKYLPLLAQFATLQQRIEGISLPKPRYASDLLPRVPVTTLLYVSIPNLGDFLSEANHIFNDQLKQSPELQQWWDQGHEQNSASLDSLVDKLHSVSQYLGEEVVVVGLSQANHAGFAVMADVQKAGLEELLKDKFGASDQNGQLIVLNESSLKAMSKMPAKQNGGFALVRAHEAVFSNDLSTLVEVNAQLDAGASGFSSGDFGQQINAAYGRGAGVILAADLHRIIPENLGRSKAGEDGNAMVKNSGFNEVQSLIAEHRETSGNPENHLNLQFSGTRQRIASWLAAPGPIGSLDFVTPNAELAIAGLSKDPKAIADDLMSMAGHDEAQTKERLNEAEQMMQISVRDDIAANLGGDFLVSLDGPVLPTPSWKAVIQVHDSAKLEQTLERLTEMISRMNQSTSGGKAAYNLKIESSEIGSQHYYELRETSTGKVIADYIFADGYMVIAASRPVVIDALRAHSSGNSLARSASFKASLPKDGSDNYSAIAYQNLSPVLTPLLSQVSGDSARAIQKLAVDAKPTSVCAWGRDTRIEAESDSHLFGFDFLALGTLFHQDKNMAGNKHNDSNVRN